jgi:fibro-slime domain-containing protein
VTRRSAGQFRSVWSLGAVVVVSLASAAGGCGRTELDPAEPCDGEIDTTRTCSGFCGAGTQTCTDSFWRACEVPVTTRPCNNDCGQGTESCFDKEWHTCEVEPVMRSCSSPCGDGYESCRENKWGACDAPQPKPPKLSTTVRDFHAHQPPDFELPLSGNFDETGIVEFELGPDDKPVYAGHPMTDTTSGAANFNEWYHDVPGVNLSTAISLPLTAMGGMADFYVYNNPTFFPIDDQLFGNEGLPHNYHFTLEAHTHFRYVGGEIFTFAGDDDTWVFINRRLAIDLGGIHSSETATVMLDAAASALQIIKGQRYQLDIFFAERHTVQSTFMIRTSIADASSCE